MDQAPQTISRSDLEALLTRLEALPGNSLAGFFGPKSITWQVNRECLVFLGAGRAALLQLAHPWVATSLAHHSNLMHDAIGRFHSTFRVVYTMLFGTRAQALAASRQLYRRHVGVRGELPEAMGTFPAHQHYEANEISALRWVYATLVDSAMRAYELVLPPLAPVQREAYYAESKRMAALCGIPPEALPTDWAAFSAYMAEMLASSQLGVGENGRAMAHSILSGVGTWVRPPLWYRALTTEWLPPRVREQFDLSFGAREQRSVARARRWLPRVYRLLPAAIRLVGPFREAQARLRGRAPGALTQRSNRFWMGQSRLLFPEL